MNALRNAFKVYQKILFKYPLCTQSIQTGTLMGVGDLIAQTLIEKKSLSNVNVLRTIRFTGVGLFIAGPGLRTWYVVLDRYVGQKGGAVAVKKVLLDQFLFAPMFLGAFLTTIGLTGGNSIEEVKKKVLADYPDVLLTNYYVWPAVQIVNFYIVPLNYQLLVVQTIAVFWNTYLSWKSNKPLENVTEVKEVEENLILLPLEKDTTTVPSKSLLESVIQTVVG